ncbi:uncharacterized protein LOC134266374 [Saccostrea cucullata]|uniref:uncharacterized protein LOC134266374 n=1 Tax=Saccostrea cuccullata TaxID=36930 RepID=UPI002ED69C79
MFINKVVGVTRESLLQQLYQYYRMGVSCLVLSPTLRSILEQALSSPSFVVSPANEGEFIDITVLDIHAMYEIFQMPVATEHERAFYTFLKSIDTLSRLSQSTYQSLTLQICTTEIFVRFSFLVANRPRSSSYTHKNVYFVDKSILNILKLAAKLGPVSYLLYLSLYYYISGRYNKTLHITSVAKNRLSKFFDLRRNIMDSEDIENLPLFWKMKILWQTTVAINSHCDSYNIRFEEIKLEQDVSKLNANPILHLPPFVLVEMLSVLSHHKLGNRFQCLQSLTDLQTLLLCDEGTYVPLFSRDLSWQILGICQELVGDFHGALQSYQESLKQEPYHKIREATYIRILAADIKQQFNRIRPGIIN